MVKVDNIYTSVACNRTSNSLDWNQANQIAFAAKNSIAIYEETGNNLWKITQQLVKHTDRVNVVKWIHNHLNQVTGLISGADDKNSIIWFGSRGNEGSFVLQGHSGSVTTVDSFDLGKKYIFVTTGADCTIKVWCGELTGEIVCVQTIDLHGRLCFALRLIPIGTSGKCLLAFGTDDCKVVLMSMEVEGNFKKILVLTGHEDWILGLDYTRVSDDDSSIILASSSQDTFIRLWKISKVRKRETGEIVSKFMVNVEADDRRFTMDNELYSVSLESVLQGHEGWVSSVHWNKSGEKLQLLSSSADKTLIVWMPDNDGIWSERVRTGEVGGNGFGFFGAKFSPNGSSIIGHAYYGSLHRWTRDSENDRLWSPSIVTSGHFAEVQDLVWEPQGKFLVTVSHDQTTRIHAPWTRNSKEVLWHELARPQIHGFDMHCVAMVSRYRLASGAEEKIVRVFDAPVNFVENFREICAVTDDTKVVETRSKGASRPTLGLSNRAVNDSTVVDATELPNHQYPEHYFVETKFTEPPKEETLMQNTLWPEIQKLYGHDGYEVFSLAASHNGKLLASSCKATTADHAQILLWDTNTWKVIQKLRSHQLTITQMKFSPNDKFLLTVSRDRKWSLFEDKQGTGNFELRGCSNPKGGVHARIIWSCEWTGDGKFFVTGSRDKKVVSWLIPTETTTDNTETGGILPLSTLDTEADVTALAISSQTTSSGYLTAIGFGTGVISLYNLEPQTGTWTLLYKMPQEIAHHLPVKRISFRPNSERIQLGSCSEDNSVKIFEINL